VSSLDWRASIGAYVRLTKPRVIELLLVTSVPPMLLAARGMPAAHLLVAVLVGGALAAGGANTINCWVERDRDQLMHRTHNRPLPAGEMVPARALGFGIALNVIAFVYLALAANLLAACLTMSATLFYVFVYTIWLKPRTAQNIVIGGAAGAVPVLVGWAAVKGDVAAPAWILFAVVFFWTPAHFWALAFKYKEDYARANIPMLPVLKSPRETGIQIAAYAAITAAVTLSLGLVVSVSIAYVIAAAVLGLLFVGQAVRLARNLSPTAAIRFFGYSNVYLLLVFAAVAADAFINRH
jgi:protoheme IX farnesyltransferase